MKTRIPFRKDCQARPAGAGLPSFGLVSGLVFSALLPALSPCLRAEDGPVTSASARLTPEQRKAIENTQLGSVPKVPSWMRGPSPSQNAGDTLDHDQIVRLQEEMARQKKASENFVRNHDRLHGNPSRETTPGAKGQPKDGTKDEGGDFVDNYLTVSGLIAGSPGDAARKEDRAETARKARDRRDEGRLTGVSEVLLGAPVLDPLAALADRLGGITATSVASGAASGLTGSGASNPFLTQGSGGAYAMGAGGALVVREQSSNPYLAASSGPPKGAPAFSLPKVPAPSTPASFSAPPAAPPPPPATALERQKAEDDRRKRLYPNLDKF